MPAWPDAVIVAVPTVAVRRGVREVTLAQWRRLGARLVVHEQPTHLPYGKGGTTSTALACWAQALDQGAEWVLHAEDDIHLDPRLPSVLPVMCRTGGPVALWSRPRFRPPGPPPASPTVAPMRQAARWYGSLAVLLPAWLADAAIRMSREPGRGIDLHLRATVRATTAPDGSPVRWWVTRPSLVEHRRLPRVACRGPYIDSGGDFHPPDPGGGWAC